MVRNEGNLTRPRPGPAREAAHYSQAQMAVKREAGAAGRPFAAAKERGNVLRFQVLAAWGGKGALRPMPEPSKNPPETERSRRYREFARETLKLAEDSSKPELK